jgi:heme/copper-type cytochrome/quinol oxidase subunit 2
MFKRLLWALAGLVFVVSAGTQLFIFTCLLLNQQIEIFESRVWVNRLEFGIASVIFGVALAVFGYFAWRLIKAR